MEASQSFMKDETELQSDGLGNGGIKFKKKVLVKAK